MKLAGKVALVTGAGSGIGRETARLFSSEGAKVVISDLDEEGGMETLKLIQESGGEATFAKCDVTNEDEVQQLFQHTRATCGKLDILFNNAGTILIKRLVDTEEHDWDQIMDVNAKGVFLCTKHAVPFIRENEQGGSIINSGSTGGLIGSPLFVAYCASKGAVVSMTRAMAVELAPFRIRVNVVCPGAIDTPMLEKTLPNLGMPMEEARKVWTASHPLQRIGSPMDVARAVLYFASDDSSYVTGSILAIDGGYTAK